MAQSSKDKQPDTPPPRRGRAEPVSREVFGLGGAAFVRAGFTDPALVLRWEEIAGPDVARIAQPIRLTEGAGGGVLTLKAEPAAALFLQHETRALCERINNWLGRPAISRLRFVQGPLETRAPRRRVQPADAKAAPDDPSGKFQGPEGLKNAILNLANTRMRPSGD